MDNIIKYYKILGLQPGASIHDIKKAYRQCAHKFHPDINKSEPAADRFIKATEAYQFLIARQEKLLYNRDKTEQFINDWERYRKEQASRRARAYSRTRYNNFVKSDMYRSTKAFDKTRLYISIILALFIISLAINGYIFRLRMVDKGFEKPALAGFIFLLFIGLIFLASSFLFLYHNHFKPKNQNNYHAKKDNKSV